MKRILTCILAVLLLTALFGCSAPAPAPAPAPTQAPAQEPAPTQEPDPAEAPIQEVTVDRSATADVSLRHCRFAKTLCTLDGELSPLFSTAREDWIYLDLALSIRNNSRELTEDDFSGYVFYGDLRYDLDFRQEHHDSMAFAPAKIEKGQGGQVHLFALLPVEAAEDSALQVTYSVCGQEAEAVVQPEDTSDPLSQKKELTAGQAVACQNDDITVELLEGTFKNYMTASDKVNSQQYTFGAAFSDGEPFAECVLKITNNTSTEITANHLAGYVITDDGIAETKIYIETENNTALKDYQSIAPGATEIIHVVTAAIQESDSEDVRIIRFNLSGSTFYCVING